MQQKFRSGRTVVECMIRQFAKRLLPVLCVVALATGLTAGCGEATGVDIYEEAERAERESTPEDQFDIPSESDLRRQFGIPENGWRDPDPDTDDGTGDTSKGNAYLDAIEESENEGDSEFDRTPEKLDGSESYEFEPDDIEKAEEAPPDVREYCGEAVSEAQELGCLSHVEPWEVP